MVATRLITVDEFEAMSLDGRWELIDGELVEMSPTGDEPSAIGATITILIGQFVRAHRLGRMYTAAGGFVLFSDRETVRAPDIAFVRADRVPQGKARKHFARLVPDLVVEVLSPSDRAGEVLSKIEMYREAGVRLIWVVDPEPKTVTVLTENQPVTVFKSDGVLNGGTVLPGFSLAVADIFAEE